MIAFSSAGMPFVASNSHFMDGDPKLLDNVDGMMPDKTKYSNDIIIDRVSIEFSY